MSMNKDQAVQDLEPTQNGWRSAAEIDEIIDMRYRKAIEHFEVIARGLMPRTCPICDYSGRFSPVRHKVDVWCPSCDSRSRHRLIKLWAAGHLSPGQIGATLHFAAETCLTDLFRTMSQKYVTADLNPGFDLQLNIEEIDLPDASFDLVIANHVFEHVRDEIALREVCRILRPGGKLLLTVPIIEGWSTTFEDPGNLSDDHRALIMSDPDHRRWYGRDIRNKIAEAGLIVSEFTAHEPDVTKHGIARGEKIFFGTVAD
jgi:SAM-dependent methyltransferase